MEIRTLRYFLTVAREENITHAAKILHVTQPTLSKAMKGLEDELGKKLFTRHSFSIRLTEEGILLRNRAEDLVSMADKIAQEFVTMDDITGGDIYLGLAESYQIRALARAIREFRKQYSELRYHITSGDTEQVTEKLDKGLLDFAVLAEKPDTGKHQDHYCIKPQSIDEYIATQDEAVQSQLQELRSIIRAAIPDAEERISWSMPTYWKGKNLIHFAASKKHLGLYPGDEAVAVFTEELKAYDVSKGTIRLPYDRELPIVLIQRIARWCYDSYANKVQKGFERCSS